MRRAAVPFLIVLGSVALYFLLLVGFGVYQRYPVAHFIACGVGSIWLLALFAQERTWGRAAVALAAVGITGGYVWYTLSYSSYAPRAQAVAEGQVLAELATLRLIDQDGEQRTLLDPEDGRATLLVLYRGYW